jgi:hypothetical protein
MKDSSQPASALNVQAYFEKGEPAVLEGEITFQIGESRVVATAGVSGLPNSSP